ncbi:MAG: DUF2165 domain-containing protein [Candidatus Dormibacteraceae bacterium]
MRLLASLGRTRIVVAILTLITALQITLISVGNLTDFGTNQAFVVHVLAMDTTFRSPHMMWRAIINPEIATGAYVAIIIWESLTALVLIAACIAWLWALGRHQGTDLARRLSTCGWLMELMLFGGGFIVVGGEWFQMWQSSKWNGLQPALQNFLIVSVGLILAHLPEREPAEA